MGQPRRMASMETIIAHWAQSAELWEENKAQYIGWGEPFCFRCGWLAPSPDPYGVTPWGAVGGWLERAHLKAHEIDGSGEPENLVPLCSLCHRHMPEFDDRAAAFAWVRSGPRCPTWWQLATDCHWSGGERWERYPGPRYVIGLYIHMASHVDVPAEVAS